MITRTITIALSLLAAMVLPANADFCPVCGTDPCRAVARSKNLPVHAPPSPALAPDGNLAVGSLISRILQGATGLKNDLEWKLVAAKPTALLNSIDRITENYEEFKNPKTVEQWGRAVHVDALLKIVKSVAKKTIKPWASTTVQTLIKLDDIKSKVDPNTPTSRKRVDQYFEIFEESTREQLTLPRQSFVPTQFSLVGFSERPNRSVDSPGEIRERLWHAMLAAYHETGQFDQAVEFHDLAVQRWGAIQDADLRAGIERIAADARGVVVRAPHVNPSESNAPLGQLSMNSALFINFRLGPGASRLEMEFVGKRAHGAPRPDSPDFRAVIHPDDQGREMELYANGIELPTALSIAEARAEWHALKYEYRNGVVTISLNGRVLGRFTKRVELERHTTYDENSKRLSSAYSYGYPPTISVKVFGQGRFRISKRSFTP